MSRRVLRLVVDDDPSAFRTGRPALDGEIVVSRGPAFDSTGAPVKSFGDYRDSNHGLFATLEESHRLVDEWGRITDHAGRSLAELTAYQEISLWRVAEINLLFTWLMPLVDALNVLERIFEAERPTAVEIVGTDRVTALAAVALARAHGVPVRWDRAERHFSLALPESLLPLASQLRAVAVRAIGRLWNRWIEARSPLVGEKRILALTVNRRFTDILLPVFAELTANPETALLIVDREFSSATGKLRSAGFPFRAFWGYETGAVAGGAWVARQEFRRRWIRLCDDPAFRGGWRFGKIDCWPAVEPKLREYFTRLFPQLVRIIETTRELVRRERPQAVVLVDERPPFQRAFVEAMRAMGVPTINIQNAVYADIPYGSAIATDYVLVDGELARENLAARGTDPRRILVTGQPRFDFLARETERFDRMSICAWLSLDPAGRIVLFASHPVSAFDPPEERRALLQALCLAVKPLPGCALIVKLHPDETNDRFHRETAASAGLTAVRVVRDMDTWELLYVSDVVVVASSTMGYEAIVMDRTLIQVIYRAHEKEIYPYAASGAALEVRTPGEISPALRRALDDEGTQEALRRGRAEAVRRFAYRLDGRASARAARFIEQVAEARPPAPATLSAEGLKR